MKKIYISVILVCVSNLYAQQGNNQLKVHMERNKEKLFEQFDFYSQRRIYQNNSKTNPKRESIFRESLNKKRNSVSYFIDGIPHFRKAFDTDQITNSNTDLLQNGTLTGLNQSYNGKGIKVSVFDGGLVYEGHRDFGVGRITNKERASLGYNSHATAVTGMIGSIGTDRTTTVNGVTISGNTKGIMPEAIFDVYSFYTTRLEGESTRKRVTDKILDSKAPLSNHSYGNVIGWEWEYSDGENAGDGFYWNGYYDPSSKVSYDLNGTYYNDDKEYDDIVYNNPNMIMVMSAGNSYGDGPKDNPRYKKYYSDSNGDWVEFGNDDNVPDNNCANGYDCIPSGAVAKNVIVVGSTNKITTNNGRYAQASDVVKSSFSSAGPRDDGAIKPDIAGVGSGIFYASTSERGSNRYGYGSGTSYSAPQVTGIIGLWSEIYQDMFNGENLNAASAKNLLIHTAQEAGNIGPDVWYGWGFADAKKGAELLLQKKEGKVIFEDKTLDNSVKDEIIVKTDGKQPLKVSIAWTDPSYKKMPASYSEAYNNRASKLVNDLDLRIINVRTNEVYYPWVLDVNAPLNPATRGDNKVDNVEQVLIDVPKEGIYKIQVSNKNNLLDNNGDTISNQDYNIIVTGYAEIVSELDKIADGNSIEPTLLAGGNNIVNISLLENINNISVYNMAGRLVRDISPNSSSYNVDFTGLPVGVYVIRVISNNYKLDKKVLKN